MVPLKIERPGCVCCVGSHTSEVLWMLQPACHPAAHILLFLRTDVGFRRPLYGVILRIASHEHCGIFVEKYTMAEIWFSCFLGETLAQIVQLYHGPSSRTLVFYETLQRDGIRADACYPQPEDV